MKWRFKRELLPISILVILLALSLYYYPQLPETLPSHFGPDGHPDSFMSKSQLFLLLGGVLLTLYLILTFIPMIDPFWRKIKPNYGIFLLFRDIAMLFFAFLFVMIYYGAKKGSLPVEIMGIAMGFLFAALGAIMPKLPRNFFFGIRTPWTLASDEVWKRSHFIGGWLFITAGILLATLSILGVNFAVAAIVILAPTVLVAAFVYPFWLYRKLQKEGRLSGPEL